MIITLDIGGTKIASGLCDPETGALSCVTRTPTLAHEGGEAVFARVADIIDGLRGSDTRAIGIGTAGVVDRAGCVTQASDLLPGWGGIALAPRLRDRFGLPVTVVNDVHAHAIAEARRGAGAGVGRCLVAAVGTGIGGALVIDGTVDRGPRGVAGHIGHTLHPAAAGLPCTCGRAEHLELVASGTGIARVYAELTAGSTPAGSEALTAPEIADRQDAGDAIAAAVIEQAGSALGEVLGSCANIVDPDVIVITGSVAHIRTGWWPAVRDGYARQALDDVLEVPLVPATLSHAALIGAALFAEEAL